MSAKDEWKDPLTPKDLSLAEDVIDELQAEIDKLKAFIKEAYFAGVFTDEPALEDKAEELI